MSNRALTGGGNKALTGGAVEHSQGEAIEHTQEVIEHSQKEQSSSHRRSSRALTGGNMHSQEE